MSTDPDQVAIAGAVWRQIRGLVFDQHDRRAEVSAALDLSFIRVKALQQVAAGPITMSELAERLNTDRPYLSVMVDDLQARGLVVRNPHPTDRRIKIVSATTAGLEAAAVANSIVGRPPTALIELDRTDLDQLAAILRRLEPPDAVVPTRKPNAAE